SSAVARTSASENSVWAIVRAAFRRLLRARIVAVFFGEKRAKVTSMKYWTALLSLCFVCSCAQERMGSRAIGVLSSGVINDPSNKSLRFDLLKFGLEQFCREMQRRGLALKMRDGDPNIGRFAATSCQSQILDEPNRQSILVRYAGRGFGWTNVTQRVGFESQGLVEYAPDFQMHGEAMYIYFRPRNVDATRFQTLLVESFVARTGITHT